MTGAATLQLHLGLFAAFTAAENRSWRKQPMPPPPIPLIPTYLEHSIIGFLELPLLSQLVQTRAGPKQFFAFLMLISRLFSPFSSASRSFSLSISSSTFTFLSLRKYLKFSFISSTLSVCALHVISVITLNPLSKTDKYLPLPFLMIKDSDNDNKPVCCN